MKYLYKKELNYYLNNPIGYIVLVLFAVFANFLFVKDIFIVGSASMRPFFNFLPWLFLIFVPALTMRIISEEKRVNTIDVFFLTDKKSGSGFSGVGSCHFFPIGFKHRFYCKCLTKKYH